MYLRIFRPSHNAKILLWTGIVLSTMFYIASIAVYLGTCLPRKEDDSTGGWLSPQFADRVYAIEGDLSAATGIVGTVIDLYILIAPLTFLWSLRLPLRRKAGVSAVFIAGSAYVLLVCSLALIPGLTKTIRACIFSVCGVVYRMRIAKPTAEAQDLSWNTMPIYAMRSVLKALKRYGEASKNAVPGRNLTVKIVLPRSTSELRVVACPLYSCCSKASRLGLLLGFPSYAMGAVAIASIVNQATRAIAKWPNTKMWTKKLCPKCQKVH